MEAFTIICEMCAAKLKVRNTSLVGQKLACPKCGSMLTVNAPEGWVPTKSPPNSTGDSSESDFEDIDAILKQATKPVATHNTSPAEKQRPGKTKPLRGSSKPVKPSSSSTNNEPALILPDDNWTAASTKSTRKIFGIIAATVAAIALIVTSYFAFTANQNKPLGDPVIANKNELPSDKNNLEENPATIEVTKGPDSTSTITQTPAAEDPSPVTDHQPYVEAATPNRIETVEIPSPPEQSEPPKIDEEATSSPPTAASPFDEVFDEILNSGKSADKKIQTNFDELSNALENVGTTITELNQFAAIKRRRVGSPKYFIQKNILQRPPRNQNGLELQCAAVQYKNQSLTSIIAEIEQITGVPIAIDADELRRIGFKFGGNIDQLLIKDSNSFKAIVRVVFGKLHDKTTLLYDGGLTTAIVTADDAATPENFTAKAPDLRAMKPDELARMLRDLIAPGTWASEGNDFKVEITDRQLQATHFPQTLYKIEQFLKKWEMASQNSSSADLLKSTWSSASDSLSKPFVSDHKYPTPIREFFSDLQATTGICFLIDYKSISTEGWSPRSTIPADIDETDIGSLLDELCHSMRIAFRMIDENTVELLSNETEQQHRDLEFYDCSKILAGPLDSEQMMELLRQSIQSAGFTANDMRAYFANEINCFIVVAPQSIQRRIESILKRLENL